MEPGEVVFVASPVEGAEASVLGRGRDGVERVGSALADGRTALEEEAEDGSAELVTSVSFPDEGVFAQGG